MVHTLLLLGCRRVRDQAQERVRVHVRYVNGRPNLARIVELVVRVVQELVGVRLLRVGPVHLIVDVLEDGLVSCCVSSSMRFDVDETSWRSPVFFLANSVTVLMISTTLSNGG